MKTTLKNYEWMGYGFPVIFNELPAVKIRGELVPDIDFSEYEKPLIEFICANQNIPLSGNQVKFIRNYLGMSLREFAKLLNVKHQSIMRWEARKNSAAQIDVNTEIVMRIKILKKIGVKQSAINLVLDKVDHIEEFELAGNYRKFVPLRVPENTILGLH